MQETHNNKKIMIALQDEAVIFKNIMLYALSLPDRTASSLPKDNDIVLIISVFTKCELGFGFTVSGDALKEVNA